MAAAKRYRAAATVVKVSIGSPDGNRIARIIRAGAPVPEGVDPSLLESLHQRGLIEPVEVDTDDQDVDVDEHMVFEGPPVKSANRKTWDAFALQAGLTPEIIAGLKKPELMQISSDPDLVLAALAAADEQEDDEDGDEDGEEPASGDDD